LLLLLRLLLQRRLLEWLLLLCLLGRPCQRGHYHGCLLLLLRWLPLLLPLLLDLQLRGWLPGPRLHAGRWRDSWPAMPACRPDVQCLQDLCERWSVQHITSQQPQHQLMLQFATAIQGNLYTHRLHVKPKVRVARTNLTVLPMPMLSWLPVPMTKHLTGAT
jgi:hypothetical protein